MRIRTKLALALGTPVIFLFVNSVVAYVQIDHIQKNVIELAEVQEPLEEALLEMEINVGETARAIFDYELDGEARGRERARDSAADFQRFETEYMRLADTDEQRRMGEDLIRQYQRFSELGEELMSLADQRTAGVRALRRSVKETDDLIEEKLAPAIDRTAPGAITKIEAAGAMDDRMEEVHAAVEGYLLAREPALRERARKKGADFDRFLAAYRETPLSAEEANWLDRIEKDFAAIWKAGEEITAIADRMRDVHRRFEDQAEGIDEILDDRIQPLIHLETVRAEQDAKRSAYVATLSLATLLLLALAAAVGTGVYLAKGISVPLGRLANAANAIGKGKFDAAIDVGTGDEIGDLAATIREMAKNLEETMAQRRRAEQALRRSEQRFKDMTEASSDWFCEMGPDLRFTFLSDSFSTLTGIKPEQILGKRRQDIAAGEPGTEEWRRHLMDLEAHRPFRDFTYQSSGPEGKTLYFRISGKAVSDAQGNFQGYRCTGSDITAQVEAKAAAARAEAQLSHAIESISEGFALFDADDRLILCNSRFRHVLADGDQNIAPGARYDEILRSALNRGRIHAAVDEAEAPFDERRSGRQSPRKPVELELDNGRWLRLSEYKTKEGGRVGIFTDITELKHREAALGESEKRFRLLAEAAPDGIMIDDGGRLIDANRNLARLLRCDYAELIGKDVFDFLTEDSTRVFAEKSDANDEAAYEVIAVRTDGSNFPAEIKSKSIPFRGRQVRVSTFRDISERRLAEERLRRSQKLEAIGQLAGGVAHDFNNLLTVIDGFTKRALAKTEDSERVTNSLAEVVKATEKAAGLTRQLLTFGRSRVLKKEVISVADMFAEAKELLRPLLGELIELRLEIADERVCVETDSGELFQAVVNLAINARDAMPAGGPLTIGVKVVDLDAELVAQNPNAEPGPYVEISVQDEGIGMDAETLGRIFEPFFTTKEPGAGTGLGLAMVYGFVRQGSGIIEVSSTPDVGSEFRMYLPFVDSKPKKTVNLSPVSCRANGETVLVVEDDDAVRLLTRETLEELGYHVLLAINGVEALEVDDDHDRPIDVLLTDVVMPVLGGPAAARAIQAERPEIKVIFMSGYPGRGTSGAAPIPDDAPFLSKPFDPYSLATLMREVLDGPPGTEAPAPASRAGQGAVT